MPATPEKGSRREPHPCLESAVQSRPHDDLQKQLVWLLREQFEGQRASLEDMHNEHRRMVEGLLSEQRSALTGMASSLKRQEQGLEKVTQSLLQHTLSQRIAGQAAARQKEPEPSVQKVVAELEASQEKRMKAMMREVGKLVADSPQGRARTAPPSSGTPSPDPGGMSRAATPQVIIDRLKGHGTALQSEAVAEEEQGGSEDDSQPERPKTDFISALAAARTTAFNASADNEDDEGSNDSERSICNFCWRHLERLSTAIILLNCIWLGVEADIGLRYAQRGEPSPPWSVAIDFIFAVVGGLELTARMGKQGVSFFTCPNVRWNLLDAVIVGVQVFDATFSGYNASFVRVIRTVRIFIAARALRKIEHLRTIRLMVEILMGCAGAFAWAAVLGIVVVYINAVALLQIVTVILDTDAPGLDPAFLRYYGSLPRTMLSLFMAVSGGESWAKLVDPLVQMSEWFYIPCIAFVCFVLLGLLNIVTAIFVDSAGNIAKVDESMWRREAISSPDSPLNKIRAILRKADRTRSGCILFRQLEELAADRKFRELMDAFGVDVHDSKGLFHMLDSDALGQVGIDEFIHGLLNMKCQGRTVDTGTMMYENQRILIRLMASMRFNEAHFQELSDALNLSRRTRTMDLTSFMESTRSSEAAMAATMSGRRPSPP